MSHQRSRNSGGATCLGRLDDIVSATWAGRKELPLSELRLIPTIRSSNFERQCNRSERVVIYVDRHKDLDESSVSAGARRVGPMMAWTWAFRRRWRVVELPEPLWLRALPLTMSLGIAARVAGLIHRKRVIIATFALENSTPRQLLRGLPPSTHRIAFGILRLFCGFAYDRIAFGSNASHHCYNQARLLESKCETAIFPDLRPPCSMEIDVIKSRKIAFVAALEPRKGLGALLDAWKLTGLGKNDWTLHIAGSGPLQAAVIKATKGDPSIHYLGPLDRVQVHKLLAESMMVVLPSQPEGRWKEQIGLSIIEGLAHGCQIIASPDTGLADWLAKRGHAILPSGFTVHDLASALRMSSSKLMDPAIIRSSLPSNDGRASAEKWMHR
jgi:glycosyltransferase involved in cell wall biosynthesis